MPRARRPPAPRRGSPGRASGTTPGCRPRPPGRSPTPRRRLPGAASRARLGQPDDGQRAAQPAGVARRRGLALRRRVLVARSRRHSRCAPSSARTDGDHLGDDRAEGVDLRGPVGGHRREGQRDADVAVGQGAHRREDVAGLEGAGRAGRPGAHARSPGGRTRGRAPRRRRRAPRRSRRGGAGRPGRPRPRRRGPLPRRPGCGPRGRTPRAASAARAASVCCQASAAARASGTHGVWRVGPLSAASGSGAPGQQPPGALGEDDQPRGHRGHPTTGRRRRGRRRPSGAATRPSDAWASTPSGTPAARQAAQAAVERLHGARPRRWRAGGPRPPCRARSTARRPRLEVDPPGARPRRPSRTRSGRRRSRPRGGPGTSTAECSTAEATTRAPRRRAAYRRPSTIQRTAVGPSGAKATSEGRTRSPAASTSRAWSSSRRAVRRLARAGVAGRPTRRRSRRRGSPWRGGCIGPRRRVEERAVRNRRPERGSPHPDVSPTLTGREAPAGVGFGAMAHHCFEEGAPLRQHDVSAPRPHRRRTAQQEHDHGSRAVARRPHPLGVRGARAGRLPAPCGDRGRRAGDARSGTAPGSPRSSSASSCGA